MSDIHICPTCHGRAKQVRHSESEQFQLKAVQDDAAFAKITQLKLLLEKERSRNSELKQKLAALQG